MLYPLFCVIDSVLTARVSVLEDARHRGGVGVRSEVHLCESARFLPLDDYYLIAFSIITHDFNSLGVSVFTGEGIEECPHHDYNYQLKHEASFPARGPLR